MLKGLVFAISALGIIGLGKIGKDTIETMGSLVHFNCRSTVNRVVCELTHEPLIGPLKTIQLDKRDLQSTKIQQGRRARDQRLAIVLKSGEEIPFTNYWSQSNNQQLFPQQGLIDQFIADASATTLYVRTHRPGQLWVILAGLLGGMGGLMAIAFRVARL